MKILQNVISNSRMALILSLLTMVLGGRSALAATPVFFAKTNPEVDRLEKVHEDKRIKRLKIQERLIQGMAELAAATTGNQSLNIEFSQWGHDLQKDLLGADEILKQFDEEAKKVEDAAKKILEIQKTIDDLDYSVRPVERGYAGQLWHRLSKKRYELLEILDIEDKFAEALPGTQEVILRHQELMENLHKKDLEIQESHRILADALEELDKDLKKAGLTSAHMNLRGMIETPLKKLAELLPEEIQVRAEYVQARRDQYQSQLDKVLSKVKANYKTAEKFAYVAEIEHFRKEHQLSNEQYDEYLRGIFSQGEQSGVDPKLMLTMEKMIEYNLSLCSSSYRERIQQLYGTGGKQGAQTSPLNPGTAAQIPVQGLQEDDEDEAPPASVYLNVPSVESVENDVELPATEPEPSFFAQIFNNWGISSETPQPEKPAAENSVAETAVAAVATDQPVATAPKADPAPEAKAVAETATSPAATNPADEKRADSKSDAPSATPSKMVAGAEIPSENSDPKTLEAKSEDRQENTEEKPTKDNASVAAAQPDVGAVAESVEKMAENTDQDFREELQGSEVDVTPSSRVTPRIQIPVFVKKDVIPAAKLIPPAPLTTQELAMKIASLNRGSRPRTQQWLDHEARLIQQSAERSSTVGPRARAALSAKVLQEQTRRKLESMLTSKVKKLEKQAVEVE